MQKYDQTIRTHTHTYTPLLRLRMVCNDSHLWFTSRHLGFTNRVAPTTEARGRWFAWTILGPVALVGHVRRSLAASAVSSYLFCWLLQELFPRTARNVCHLPVTKTAGDFVGRGSLMFVQRCCPSRILRRGINISLMETSWPGSFGKDRIIPRSWEPALAMMCGIWVWSWWIVSTRHVLGPRSSWMSCQMLERNGAATDTVCYTKYSCTSWPNMIPIHRIFSRNWNWTSRCHFFTL